MTDVLARIGLLLVVATLLLPEMPDAIAWYLGDAFDLALLVYGVVLLLFVVADLGDVDLLVTADAE